MAFHQRSLTLLALAVACGLLGGALVGWATLALSNTDIGGPGWSLRGNGALIVEVAAGPALLAGGWVLLARRRLGPSLIASVFTLAIELAVGFGPLLAGPAAGPRTQVLVGVLAPVLALVAGIALVWPPGRKSALAGLSIFVLATALTLGLPFLVFILAPLLLPLVLATPTLVQHAHRPDLPAAVALPFALLAGIIGAQRVLAGT